MKWKAVLLLALLGVAAFAAPARAEAADDDDDSYEEEDDVAEVAKTFLMVRRKLSEEKPQVGKPLTVIVELYNAGASPATGVTAKEEPWHAEAFSTTGDLEAAFETIPAGTTYSFSYTVTPKFALERYEHRPTLVTYTAAEGGDVVSTTSPWLSFRAHTGAELLTMRALAAGSSLTLGGLNTESDWVRFGAAVGALALGLAAWRAYTAFNEARVNSLRRKALKEFGVVEEERKGK